MENVVLISPTREVPQTDRRQCCYKQLSNVDACCSL